MATTALRPAATHRTAIYDWLTTTDHKKIGILYFFNSLLLFLVGGILALAVRTELAQPGLQLMDESTYNQAFTMHASVMIFWVVIPFLAGLGNYLVPLMIGAPDMAFPRINALSFWLLPLSALIALLGFPLGGAADTGWTAYSPLAQEKYSGIGQDLWIIALLLVGTSSILGAINFLVTIFKLRAPGMTLFRMPIFVWTMLVTSVLVLMGTPVLTSALAMLYIDRNLGGSFFNTGLAGGNAILWQNVFWFYSHPAVYIMILPAMGVVSEILPTFSRKPLFGYRAFVFATAAIGALGFSVWAHHMFTTGEVYLPFFSFMTFLIAVPTGVKMFNWIATLWRGQLIFSTAMLFALGFLSMFLIGGINGAFLASVPVDFHVHATYWIVSHIHYVLFGGSIMGVFAASYYWFPKMFGRKLSETLGKVHFSLVFIGLNLTFFPMHVLGISGMPRRIADYSATAGWNDLNLTATIGGFMIAVGVLPFLWNIFVSIRSGEPAGDDPWEGNTLEWATSSPPPPYNFDRLPPIRSERPVFDLRHAGDAPQLTRGH